jgi:autotransporter-associated beta strand protein
MKKLSFLIVLLICLPTLMAQRKMEYLDRGVVAMPKSSNQIFISWRHFATDPDEIAYNVYYKTSPSGGLTKLNPQPITNSTNYLANLSTASNAYTFVVKSVLNDVEKDEPGEFTVPRNTVASRYVKDFDFEPLPAGSPTMTMKFCWPADLNGDGKYDFVLDRQNYGAVSEDGSGGSADYPSPKVEAYTSEGEFLWRIDMGYNVTICNGHDDMVTAYDMDGDGKAEVLMAVSEGTTFADGKVVTAANGTVTDYRSRPGSAPQWLSIVNGETGVEIDRIALPMQQDIATTRTDKWKDISGHFIIAYLDGIRPSLIYQYKNRQSNGAFTGCHAAFSFKNNQLNMDWAGRFYAGQADFHQVRVGDVTGDGRDNFVEGGYALEYDGSLLYKAPGVVHGDRHTLADIDPDRPGLEHFFIQQDNPNTLGMGLFDAGTGEMIKGLYMSAVGDVGRGLCAAFDPTRRGLQFWSTMSGNAMYDSKGNLIAGATGTFPAEPLWFGPDLARWEISGIGGPGANLAFHRYNSSSKNMERVTPNFYNESNGHGAYYFKAAYGGRAACWADIYGDWREEVVCVRSDDSGFVILSSWDVTNHRIYTLMQNPAYRGQVTARGYYQTADVDFYMANDMPKPPIAPVQKADLYYTGSGWVDGDDVAGSYADGKSIMFDLRADNTNYTINSNVSPSRIWLMNPKGKNYTFGGSGKITGATDIIKSMQGDVVLNGNHDYTGLTRVSEGRLFVNGTIASKVQVDARGVIGGSGTLSGGIELETGLNVEGGRIEPGNGSTIGTLTVVGNLTLPGRNNLAFDIDQMKTVKNDVLSIQGDFTVTGNNHTIIINPLSIPKAGSLTLVTFTGTTNATAANFSVNGMEGIPYDLVIDANSIKMVIDEPRDAGSVFWKGNNSAIWDFQTKNFLFDNTTNVFVPGDIVTFDDTADKRIITLNKTMPVGGMIFNNAKDYQIKGSGVISGNGGLEKTGTGKLSLLTAENTFTGGVRITDGVLEVSSLKDGGLASSIGASSSAPANWVMENATLRTTSQMATNRSMQVIGTLTVNNPTTSNSVLISGSITGASATLELTGKGTLTLSGNNAFSQVKINDGLLLLASSNGNRYSMGSAAITLNGGVFRMHDVNSTGDTGTFSNEVEVPEGKTARWDLPSRWGISSKLTGGGTITVNAPYVRSDFNGDWSQFTGTIKFTGRDIRLNNAGARNMINASVDLGSGTYTYVANNGSGEASSGQTFTFGALSGSGGIAGKNNIVVGAKNENSVYSGVIAAGSGKLSKNGTATLTLSGGNLHVGGVDVNAGRLLVANTEGSATGIGNVSVKNGASIGGSGTVGGNTTILVGGSINPGDDAASGWMSQLGTLTFAKNLTLNGTLKMGMRNGAGYASDKLLVKGNTTISGALIVEIVTGADIVPLDAELSLLELQGKVSGEFSSVTLPATAEGTEWDLSELYTDGKIRVVSVSGVGAITDNQVLIYPNPVTDFLMLELGYDESYEVKVLDVSGKILKITTLHNNKKLYVNDLADGFYWIQYTGSNQSGSVKFIKTN